MHWRNSVAWRPTAWTLLRLWIKTYKQSADILCWQILLLTVALQDSKQSIYCHLYDYAVFVFSLHIRVTIQCEGMRDNNNNTTNGIVNVVHSRTPPNFWYYELLRTKYRLGGAYFTTSFIEILPKSLIYMFSDDCAYSHFIISYSAWKTWHIRFCNN